MTVTSNIISRYEAKYLVSEGTARAIATAIQGICSLDRYADQDGRYIVNNLYFDTPDLRFYTDTKHHRQNRFKPRVRYYGLRPDRYLWVELKHKRNNVTWKFRRRVDLSEWPSLIDEGGSDGGADKSRGIADSFEDAVLRFQARPSLHVQYVREPYVSDIDDYGRITFDRRLAFRPAYGSFDLTATDEMVCYDDAVTSMVGGVDSPVVLEIKTETRVPIWVVDLVRRFDLSQRGFSKYCYGVDNAMSRIDGSSRMSA
jgi:hypothetical protein